MKPTRRRSRRQTRCCRSQIISNRRKTAFFLVLFLACLLFGQQGLRAATIESEVSSFVRQVYADNEIKITFAPLPQNVQGEVRVMTLGFSRVPDASGEGICLVGVEGKNGRETNVYVPFKVMVRRALYMAKHNIGKGDVIPVADLAIRESYLNGVTTAYPAALEDVIGKKAKKEIPAGAIITSDAIESTTAVKKGEAVNITAGNERLSVQGKGTALDKGQMGDLIRVKSQAGKEVVGKVTGSNTVVVKF